MYLKVTQWYDFAVSIEGSTSVPKMRKTLRLKMGTNTKLSRKYSPKANGTIACILKILKM